VKQSVICDRNFVKICDVKYSETCLDLTSLAPDVWNRQVIGVG